MWTEGHVARQTYRKHNNLNDMKTMRKTSLAWLLALLACLTACEKEIVGEQTEEKPGTEENATADKNGPDDRVQLTVKTRSANGEAVSTPVHVYAFNTTTGSLAARQTVATASEALSLALPQNQPYRIVAVACDENSYVLPDSPTLSSLVQLRQQQGGASAGHTSASPLQMGFADIQPTTDNATLHILLNYQVASLHIDLNGLPDDCSAASVAVSSTASGVSFATQTEGQQMANIPCTLSEGTWTTGQVYLFPTTGQQTVFTISFTIDGTSYSSAATYNGTLNAGTPYYIKGSYDDQQIQVEGSIGFGSWGTPVNLTFDFGIDFSTSIVGEGGSPDTPSDPNATVVSAIPAPASLWQQHIVAAVLDSNGQPTADPSTLAEATLLLLSRSDWAGMTSALNTTKLTTAFYLAEQYNEYGLTGWTIPDSAQCRALTTAYTSYRAALVGLLNSEEADPIVVDDGENFVRYLCEEAKKTFRFDANSYLDAGAKPSNYHLRLVYPKKVKVQQ